MEVTALDYNDLPNIPREMRRALFKRYLAKLGGLGMFDPKALEYVQCKANGFQEWLHLPLSQCFQHPQAGLIQEEEDFALAAALWWLTRDKRINVGSRMILGRWSRMARSGICNNKKEKARKHKRFMLRRENKITVPKIRKPGL